MLCPNFKELLGDDLSCTVSRTNRIRSTISCQNFARWGRSSGKHTFVTIDSFESKPPRSWTSCQVERCDFDTLFKRRTPEKGPIGKARAGRNTGVYDNFLTVDYKRSVSRKCLLLKVVVVASGGICAKCVVTARVLHTVCPSVCIQHVNKNKIWEETQFGQRDDLSVVRWNRCRKASLQTCAWNTNGRQIMTERGFHDLVVPPEIITSGGKFWRYSNSCAKSSGTVTWKHVLPRRRLKLFPEVNT